LPGKRDTVHAAFIKSSDFLADLAARLVCIRLFTRGVFIYFFQPLIQIQLYLVADAPAFIGSRNRIFLIQPPFAKSKKSS
jgi:hypothetical protein